MGEHLLVKEYNNGILENNNHVNLNLFMNFVWISYRVQNSSFFNPLTLHSPIYFGYYSPTTQIYDEIKLVNWRID